MKKHLPAESRDHQQRIKQITDIITNIGKDKIAFVILFGSFARGDWVYHTYQENGIIYNYASDYDPYILVIESGRTRIVLNSEGIPLEVTFPPFVLNLIIQQGKYYPLNRLLHFILENTLIKKMIIRYKKGLMRADKRLIFSPKAMMLAKKDARFHLMQHNLLKASPLSRPVNVFRAMNILNLSYFTSDEFKIVIGHIFNALSDHGLFLMGSNQDSNTTVHGGIFLKTRDRFQEIGQSGDKSPIVDMVLQHRHPS